MSTSRPATLAQGYLDDLRTVATERLGPLRADELVSDIREHIEEAVDADQPLEQVIHRLGSPREIVAAEAPAAAAPSAPTPHPSRLRAHEIWAVVLLLAGAAVLGVGWIAGVVLLWTSDRWSTRDKLLGTLLWPGGLAPLLFSLGFASSSSSTIEECVDGVCRTVGDTSTGPPAWVGIAILAVLLVVPIATAVHLLRAARVPRR